MNRRRFLKTVALTKGYSCFSSACQGASDRLRIAAIGVGGKGRSDLDQLARHGEIVAACDVNRSKLDYALRSFPHASKFSDYREMIARYGGKIDLLSISSPDHTHAHAAQLALLAGVHLFVQPPVAQTVWESRQLRLIAASTQVCTQVGLQACAEDDFRVGVEFLQRGGLGDVLEIHAWTNRPIWPQSPLISSIPSSSEPIPDELDWNAFLGPSPERPYHSCYQPYKWRGWRNFGTGALGDTGVHLLNLPAMGCHLYEPQRIVCLTRGPFNPETYPAWGTVRYDFPSSRKGQMISVYWYEGRIGRLNYKIGGEPNLPGAELFLGKKITPQGFLIIGTRGRMFSSSEFGADWEVSFGKEWLNADMITHHNPTLGRNGRGDSGMKEELVHAIRGKGKSFAIANFEYSAQFTEWILLGNVAMAVGGEFAWNARDFKSDRMEVNRFLSKDYRSGWRVRAA